jgi:leucyl-tRNA synthetase
MPVDLYIGGSEHAVLHLLYARFWHKVLFDAGFVSSSEPFARLVHQGMILGELEFTLYRDEQGRGVSAEHVRNDVDTLTGLAVTLDHADEEQVEKRGDKFVLRDAPDVVLEARAFKMSKSRGNVVNPDDVIARYGADAFRLYEMFMGPLEQVKPWNTRGVEGTFRFLNRAWRLIAGVNGDERDDDVSEHGADGRGGAASGGAAVDEIEPTREQLRALHQAIAKVTEDLEALRFNTAISALMELVNAAYKWPSLPRAVAEPFVLLLAPLAPHLAEELWQRLGHAESLAYRAWPAADPAYLRVDVIEIPVQVNGKVRAKIQVPAEAGETEVIDIARADQNVGRHLEGQTVKRAIYVRGRIVNFVVGG